jgi:hypothetical protein
MFYGYDGGYDGYSEYDPYSHDAEPEHCEYEYGDTQYHDNADHEDAPEGYKHEHEELGYEADEAQELEYEDEVHKSEGIAYEDEEGVYGYEEPVYEEPGYGYEEPIYEEPGYAYEEPGYGQDGVYEPQEHDDNNNNARAFTPADYEVVEPPAPYRFSPMHPTPTYVLPNTFPTPTHPPSADDIPLSTQHGHVVAVLPVVAATSDSVASSISR